MESDGALARRAQGGDEAAFEVLLRRYARSAYIAAMAVLREPADADDAVQDAYLRAWRHLAQCQDPERFAPWLLTIVRRAASNHLRRIRTRREVSVVDHGRRGPADEAARRLHRHELRNRLLRAIEALSPGQRDVLLLHDVEALNHSEVAASLGISEAMSRRHLSDARRRMRDHLSEGEGDAP